jgi:hypothetical protein
MMETRLTQKLEIQNPLTERTMPAVVEAREMILAVPFDPAVDTKGAWLRRAGALLGLGERKAARIFYREVKRIDADTFNRMRAKLNELQEQANENTRRLNDLIHLRNELRAGGGRSLAVDRDHEAAGSQRCSGESGSGVQEAGPTAPVVPGSR